MDRHWEYDCPGCGPKRDFTALVDFIMPNGERAFIRSCVACEYKRYFTQDGIPFDQKQRKRIRKKGINPNDLSLPIHKDQTNELSSPIHKDQTNELSSPINKDQKQKTPKTPKKSPLTRLQAFINRESNLSSKEKGSQFEKLCEQLLKAMGYKVKHIGRSGDRGVDLWATRQEPIGNQKLVIQCKNQERVSADVVIQIYGMATAETAHLAVVITTGVFTSDARKFAREHSNIVIIDRDKLADLAKQYLI